MKQKTAKPIDHEWDQIRSLWKRGLVHPAILHTKKYLKNNPLNPAAYVILGDCLTECFRYDEAIKNYRKGLKLWGKKKRFVPLSRIARLYEKKGQFSAAERWYRNAVEQEKGDANSLILLGAVLGKQGRFSEAKACYKKAISKNVTTIDEAYILLAEILAAEGKFSEALKFSEKSLKIDPNYQVAKNLYTSVEAAIKAQHDID